jgi:AcrR family transcriptional regulator
MANPSPLRELILRETEQAILQEGYFGVSLRQVASSAGVHPGTIGALFGGKKGLLMAAEQRLRESRLETATR